MSTQAQPGSDISFHSFRYRRFIVRRLAIRHPADLPRHSLQHRGVRGPFVSRAYNRNVYRGVHHTPTSRLA